MGANINDYLVWRGDIKISKNHEFNELDSLILARFAYMLFHKISLNSQESIKSIAKKMQNFDNSEFLYNGDKELITNLGKAKRFCDMLVTNYEQNNDKTSQKQFGAITIHTKKDEIYISFLGTDNSIFGWNESFNMAFMQEIPSQICGKEYLNKIAKAYPNKKIRIGGHSKGGNIAVYSALSVDSEIANRVIKIYNYDGPGFNTKFDLNDINSDIVAKIQTYIPQDSIIGRLLNHKEKFKVVKSSQKGLLQHDIFSWQVLRDDFIYAKSTKTSKNIDKALSAFLVTASDEELKIAIDTAFRILYASNAESFNEILSNLPTALSNMLREYGKISSEQKKNIIKIATEIILLYIGILRKQNRAKFKNLQEQYIEFGKSKFKELGKKYINKFIKEIDDKIDDKKDKI